MAVIESFSPIFKACLNFEAERTGCRPQARTYYESLPNGDQRLLLPAGGGMYDLFVYCTIPLVNGYEKDHELRAYADRLGKTHLEDKAPHLIGNITYVFSVVKWGSRFVRSRSRIAGPNHRIRYWFFSSKEAEKTVISHIRSLSGRLYASRAVAILEACRKKHVEPYKALPALISFFNLAGQVLEKYAGRLRHKCRSRLSRDLRQAGRPVQEKKQAARVILDGCRVFFPALYEPVRSLMGSIYPEMGSSSAPPPGPPAS